MKGYKLHKQKIKINNSLTILKSNLRSFEPLLFLTSIKIRKIEMCMFKNNFIVTKSIIMISLAYSDVLGIWFVNIFTGIKSQVRCQFAPNGGTVLCYVLHKGEKVDWLH